MGMTPTHVFMIGANKLQTFASGFTEHSREVRKHHIPTTNSGSFETIEKASVQEVGKIREEEGLFAPAITGHHADKTSGG